ERGPVSVGVNRYYLEEPEQALGEHGVSTQITDGAEGYILNARPGEHVPDLLAQAIERLPLDVLHAADDRPEPSAATLAAAKGIEGSFVEGEDGNLYTVAGEELRPAGRFIARGSGKARRRDWSAFSAAE